MFLLMHVVAPVCPATRYKARDVLVVPFCRTPLLTDLFCQCVLRLRPGVEARPCGCLRGCASVVSSGRSKVERKVRSECSDRPALGPLLKERQVGGAGSR